ncbi:enhancer of mRNA-decapping protein 4-like isoform X2 [Magnolia sinica]|uniref:enhancer of mRNA-decapping protein 4-like isoform X2 n=1 Tax=Magnolia sinica TaxID=86752 RepID=UPI002658C43B|nr:enhancer of mRNA-decapping protein 4-like isoform X2 [Magnolia sinica]
MADAAMLPSASVRVPSRKLPKGRHLVGKRVAYDVDVRLPGELQPQLEAMPFMMYESDPGLVLGRKIAVNRTYICYGLKTGEIMVRNINNALRSFLKGHTQRVIDMAFFGEDVHLLASSSIDGRIIVWKINEGPDENDKPQITGKVVVAIHMVGDLESFHPPEILVVAIGNRVLKIDTTKVENGGAFSAEQPITCPVEKLINGVQLVGKHKGDVTDLSICHWITSRLVSASTDGLVKIWEDWMAVPLGTLRPHVGQPVNSVNFLTAPHCPNHIVLITAGHLNREVKMWASAGIEGWLIPRDFKSWRCIQTLDLKSSAESQAEEAFFNQVVVLPDTGLVLLANAKKNAIYVVHVEYGPHPTATRMDYIAEFTVTMPILSLTGRSDCSSDGEHVVEVYCVQTQAIQQYTLDLSQCLPPPLKNAEIDRVSGSGFSALDPSCRNVSTEMPVGSATSKTPQSSAAAKYSVFSETQELPRLELATSSVEPSPIGDRCVDTLVIDYSVDRRVEVGHMKLTDDSSLDETKVGKNDIYMVPNPPTSFKVGEIFSKAVPSSESTLVGQGSKVGEKKVQDVAVNNEVREVGQYGLNQLQELDSQREERSLRTEEKEKSFYTQVLDLLSETSSDGGSLSKEISGMEETHRIEDVGDGELLEWPWNAGEQGVQDSSKDVPNTESSMAIVATELPSSFTRKKKVKQPSQVTGPSSPSVNPFKSADSSNEPGSSSGGPSIEAIFTQILALQESMKELMTIQKEMQEQMTALVTVPVNKEGSRVEAALSLSMEKSLKSNCDALWNRIQEENKKQKLERDRIKQITGSISGSMNTKWPAMFKKTLKQEIAAIGPAGSRAITPILEKTVSSAIADSFQRGVGNNAVNQLEKSINSNLEATVTRQIQAQFQTSGKQVFQDAIRASLASSVIPAFEQACKIMFEQVDAAFQKTMVEQTSAAQQQFESTNSPLALALRDAMNSASSIAQTLSGELAVSQRKLLAFVAAGANEKAMNPLATQQSDGPLGGLHDIVEAPLDPKKELERLISEHKYGEAFTSALQRSDVTIVSWLCSQVDLQAILSVLPLPLSQGVLLSLLQQLACDIGNKTSQKLDWMGDVVVAIDPVDPTIAAHGRPIFEQVHQILDHQRVLPTTTTAERSCIRLIMRAINSVLKTCK